MNTDSIPLSERELNIAQLVTTGLANNEIAHRLDISHNTVKVHLRHIFEKTGAASRTELALLAIRNGWVENPAGPEAAASSPALPPVHPVESPSPAIPPAESPAPPITRRSAGMRLAAAGLGFAAFVLALGIGYILFSQPAAAETSPPPSPLSFQATTRPADAQAGQPAGRWTLYPSLTTGRAGLALAFFEGRLFAIGGAREGGLTTRLVEIYDPTGERWTEGATKPTAASNISAAVLGDRIYVPGGCDNDTGQALETLDIYDPALDRWYTGPALPGPRCAYGLVAVNDTLYLFGGWDGQDFQDSIFAFSPATGRWRVLETRIPHTYGFMGAAVLGKTIYLVGGYDGAAELASVYAFTPADERWAEKAPLPEARGGLGLVEASGRLYAAGGGWAEASGSSEVYDPAANAWTAFEVPFSFPWRNIGLTVSGKAIVAVGGWNNPESRYLSAVAVYPLPEGAY